MMKKFSPRLLVLLLLGLSSGLPLALSGGTFQAWLTVEGISLEQIGFLTLVGVAYTFKFLWAPLMDKYVPPFLGRRKGWVLASQLLIGVVLIMMGMLRPQEDLFYLAILATLLAFLSATQDIAFDAYSTEVLTKEERPQGIALRTLGYRLGMMISGGLGLVLAARFLDMPRMYMLMGGLMIMLSVVTFFAPQTPETSPPRSLQEAFLEPFKAFFSRPEAWAMLCLIILYKLGDAFAGALSSAFLIRGAGFSLEIVGWVNKVFSLGATIAGTFLGASLMNKWGLYRSLMIFGLWQAVSNLAYAMVALFPENVNVMIVAVGIEHLCGGMGSVAFVALVMGLCQIEYTGTQFALLSALATVGRIFLAGPLSPVLVSTFGWFTFFLMTVLLALPGLLLLWWYKDRIQTLS